MTNAIKFANLEIEARESSHEITYVFRGDVDENFRQQDVPRIRKNKIIFELDGVANFNSCGIREWIYLIKDFSKLGTLIFRGCSVTMIDQINMVPDSLGSASIESLYAPYFCTDHGEINQKIILNQHIGSIAKRVAPEFKCPHCSNQLAFDALEESYFLFADQGITKTAV